VTTVKWATTGALVLAIEESISSPAEDNRAPVGFSNSEANVNQTVISRIVQDVARHEMGKSGKVFELVLVYVVIVRIWFPRGEGVTDCEVRGVKSVRVKE
jgi:hypothetical protein